MTGPTRPGNDLSLADAAEIQSVGIDDLSSVRYIHATSLRMLAASQLTEAEIAAVADYVYAGAYSRALAEAVRSKQMIGAWIGPDLVGTAGWSPADDSGATARIWGVSVLPLFRRAGLGHRLVTGAENDARRAGFSAFALRSTSNATGFFAQLGYEISSHGVWALTPEVSLPVAFLRKVQPVADA